MSLGDCLFESKWVSRVFGGGYGGEEGNWARYCEDVCQYILICVRGIVCYCCFCINVLCYVEIRDIINLLLFGLIFYEVIDWVGNKLCYYLSKVLTLSDEQERIVICS